MNFKKKELKYFEKNFFAKFLIIRELFKNRSISTFTVYTKIIKREICESITGDTYSILTKTYGRFQLLSSLFFELLSPFLTKIKKMKKKKKTPLRMRSLKAISNCRGSDVVTLLVRIRLRLS